MILAIILLLQARARAPGYCCTAFRRQRWGWASGGGTWKPHQDRACNQEGLGLPAALLGMATRCSELGAGLHLQASTWEDPRHQQLPALAAGLLRVAGQH